MYTDNLKLTNSSIKKMMLSQKKSFILFLKLLFLNFFVQLNSLKVEDKLSVLSIQIDRV